MVLVTLLGLRLTTIEKKSPQNAQSTRQMHILRTRRSQQGAFLATMGCGVVAKIP
jgi:hypothetical protein